MANIGQGLGRLSRAGMRLIDKAQPRGPTGRNRARWNPLVGFPTHGISEEQEQRALEIGDETFGYVEEVEPTVPVVPPPLPMPDPGDPAVRATSRRRSIQAQAARRGRASTVLSGPSEPLGA